MLTDTAYRQGYPIEKHSEEREAMLKNKEFISTEEDIIFEAAAIMRCGKDLFVQHGFTTKKRGIDWLKRLLG